MKTGREITRDMMVAAGRDNTEKSLRKAYRAVRRPEIVKGLMPPSKSTHDLLWSARQAMIVLGCHTDMWKIGREIDCQLIAERDGK